MTDSTKASILLGALVLAVLAAGAFGAYQSRGKAAALHQAAVAQGEAHAAQQAEAQAEADRAAAQKVAEEQLHLVADLRHQLAQHPMPPPAQPVPPDASADLVVAGLVDLGLHPRQLEGDLAVGLTLPDGRTTLTWGREAQRVPALAARLETLDSLAQAQEGATGALLQRADAADRATAAADARADAEHRRAESLQRAIDLTPRWRPTAVGLIAGLDYQGQRHLGVIASRSFGPIEVGALYLNRTAGVTAVIRF